MSEIIRTRKKRKTNCTIFFIIFILALFAGGAILYCWIDVFPLKKPIPENQEKINFLVEQISNLGIKIKKGPEIRPDQTVKFLTEDDIKIIFDLNQDIKKQIIALQAILKSAKMEDKKPKSIDLGLTKSYVKF